MARSGEINKGSRLVMLAAVCIVVAALYFAQDVLIPLALAVLFCFLLAPLVTRLQRLGVKRIPAVIIVLTAATGIVIALTWATTVQLYNLADHLPQYRGEIDAKTRNLKRVFGGADGGIVDKVKEVADVVEKASTTTQPAATQPATQAAVPGSIEQMAKDPVGAVTRKAADASPSQAPPIGTAKSNPLWTVALQEPSSPLRSVLGTAGVVASPLGTAGLVLVFVIFMLIQREDLRDRIIRLVGKGQLYVTTTALDDAAKRISRYMLAQAVVNGTYGLAVGIGLWAIGYFVGGSSFPSFVLWGLLCAVLRFIPYIGPWIAAAFPIVLSLAVYHGFTVFLCVAVMFVVIELLSNNLMEPWLYGASTGISTIAVLVSAVFWTWLWGVTGLLLATPLTVCLVVLGKYVPQLQFLDILLGDEPVLDPPDRIYQRLLALDQEEATELAQAYLKEKSLEQVFDEVLLPALAMAEIDRHRGNLGEDREQFIMQAMREMVEELADTAMATAAKPEVAPVDENGKASAGARTILPQGCTVNVVCLPARDEGDDIASNMLAQLLAARGFCSFAIPVASLASEMVGAVEARQADIVVVSALPPGAVSYSRYLCKRLHTRFPETPMTVGLWTIKGDLKKAKERITCAADVRIATTLTNMLEIVHQMAQPMMMKQAPAEPATQPSPSSPPPRP